MNPALGAEPSTTDNQPKSSGTGFFITDDGYLLSNFHVVAEADWLAAPAQLQDRRISTELGSDLVQLLVRLQMIPQIQPPFGGVEAMHIGGGEFHRAVMGFDAVRIVGIRAADGEAEKRRFARLSESPRMASGIQISSRRFATKPKDGAVAGIWSATGYLRMVFHGLFGLKFDPDGVRFTPTLPPGWGAAQLKVLRYRQAVLNLRLEGEGQQIASVSVDEKSAPSAFISANLTGEHQITIRLRPA